MERSLSFSDTESAPEVRRLRGPWGSASETDLMRKALVDELHQRFSSAESLYRAGMTGRYRHHQRAASISGLSRSDPDWKSTSIEELRARKSSKSIEVTMFLYRYFWSFRVAHGNFQAVLLIKNQVQFLGNKENSLLHISLIIVCHIALLT